MRHAGGNRERLLAVMTNLHAKDMLSQHVLQQFAYCRVIIDHQNYRFHVPRPLNVMCLVLTILHGGGGKIRRDIAEI